MKKLITFLLCAVLSIGTAMAQNSKTYTGFVVDKNGNPVVGAEVMAPGGGASAITDSDGSFTIEVPFMLKKLTASYTGMINKTLKLGESSNLVFKMKSLKKMTGFISFIGNFGVFNENYEEHGRYINHWVNGVYSSDWLSGYSDNSTNGSLGGGIMGGQIGQLSKWGWYLKGVALTSFDAVGALSVTAGPIIKLSSKAHLYFGGGGAYVYDALGFSVDLGTIFTVGDHINIIAGLNYTNANYNDEYYKSQYNLMNLNIGVGYTF